MLISFYRFQPLGFPQLDSLSFDEITEFLRKLFLSSNKINQLYPTLLASSEDIHQMNPLTVQGGSHVLFAIKFTLPNGFSYILKIYKIKLADLILHCLSSAEFEQRINLAIVEEEKNLGLRTLPVIGIGNLSIDSQRFPFMIQEYSSKTPIKDHQEYNQLLQLIVKIGKSVLAEGFHFDLAPGNYLVSSKSKGEIGTIDYVDLIAYRKSEVLELTNETIEIMTSKKGNAQFLKII